MQIRTLVISVLAVGALCGAAIRPAAAQVEPRTTLAGGYTYVREQGPGGLGVANYPVGWVIAASQRLGSGRLSGAGEVGISSRDNFFGEKQRLLGLLGGVLLSSGLFLMASFSLMTSFSIP